MKELLAFFKRIFFAQSSKPLVMNTSITFDRKNTDTFVFGVENGVAYTADSTTHSSTFEWNFGDGHHSQEATPIHQYHTPGVYKVRCTYQPEMNGNTILETYELETEVKVLRTHEGEEVFPGIRGGMDPKAKDKTKDL